MMDWRRLLSANRMAGDAPDPVDPARSPFQKDFDRIVFCSAFRRLQDKTQAHPKPGNDYVRTRLTHSLEVASVGRSLGAGVGQVIAGRRRLPEGLGAAEFGHIVSAACLAHDIGNPPFGHRGEDLIRGWFAGSRRGQAIIALLTGGQREDLLRFEGNAQGFRILTRLQNWRDNGGLRLTAATLGAFGKYPRLSDSAGDATGLDAGAKKFGVMQAEASIFRRLADELGLEQVAEGRWLRHPLAFLVEAADDICYSIVDLEDGFKLGKLGFADTEALLAAVAGPTRRYGEIDEEPRRIAYLRAKAIGRLIEQVIEVFLADEPGLLDGRRRAAMLERVPARGVLRDIAEVTAREVFVPDIDYDRRFGADRAIAWLMDCAIQAADPGLSAYDRALAATDHVSGMTDGYALQQFRENAGMVNGAVAWQE